MPRRRRGTREFPNVDGFHDDILPGLILRPGFHGRDGVDHVHAVINLAENRVAEIEMRRAADLLI